MCNIFGKWNNFFWERGNIFDRWDNIFGDLVDIVGDWIFGAPRTAPPKPSSEKSEENVKPLYCHLYCHFVTILKVSAISYSVNKKQAGV